MSARIMTFLICAAVPVTARAQPPAASPPEPVETAPVTPTTRETLPMFLPLPRPPKPPLPDGAPPVPPIPIVKEAGVGSVAFASQGVVQLGGSAGLRAGSETTQLALTPQIGWFVWDHLQASAILDITHIAVKGDNVTSFTGLVEPSVHLPIAADVFIVGGVGLGATWETDRGGALAAAPRLGAELLIGRSGILTPSLSYLATTHTEMQQRDALRVNLGYSVMW